MKKILIALTFVSILHSFLQGQTSSDALRYSRLFLVGTARSEGVAGAFGAIGADFSVLATNPSGLGLYQKSEISITPLVHWAYTKSIYNGYSATDQKTNFAFGNFGFIFTVKPYKNRNKGIQNINIAFGMNRLNDFNNRMYMYGPNHTSSMLTSFINELNATSGITPSMIEERYHFDVALAYNAELIYYDSINGRYTCDMPNGGVSQGKAVTTFGSMNEFDLSFAANYNNRLYFGFTIGIPYIRYYESSRYEEWDSGDTIPYFQSSIYDYNLESHGTGINFKAGLIFRPLNWLRIGAAIHTPTWFGNMRDNWSTSLYAYYDSVLHDNSQYSPLGTYDYRMTTPFRAIGSFSVMFATFGLFSFDYEYVDYSQARFNSSLDSYTDINSEIRNSYKSWGNIRVGTEWKVADFRIRGGFAYFSNPYKYTGPNSERFQFGGGFGYRGKYFFADITYTWSKMNEEYFFYDPSLLNPSLNTIYSQAVISTIGFRF